MFIHKHLLAIIEEKTEHQPALEQAIEIARVTGAQITAFLNIYDFASEVDAAIAGTFLHNMKRCTLDRQREWLTQLLARFQSENIKIRAVVDWNKQLHVAVLEELKNQAYDCVLKTAHHHALLKRILFTPKDWHLIRSCPVPLFLIQEKSLLQGKALVGVDLADIVADAKREALNTRLIHTAQSLKETFGLTPYLIHAYPSIPALMATTPDMVSPGEFQEELKAYRKKSLQNLAAQHAIDPAHTLLAEGPIEVVVAQTAEELFADWVIMGSHARVGASGFFIGNTAEALLERTSRNMLVVPQKT
jgi:universal stress protein E